jgi:hypothetical protein
MLTDLAHVECVARIRQYICDWHTQAPPKEVNNPEFTKDLVSYLKLSKAKQWSFTGENGYCGYTAIFDSNSGVPFGLDGIRLEFAYDHDYVIVFTVEHGGFWVPPYLHLKEDRTAMYEILKDRFFSWGGF